MGPILVPPKLYWLARTALAWQHGLITTDEGNELFALYKLQNRAKDARTVA